MSPRRFALMRREEINAEPSVKAEGIVFHGGPVAVFWVHQQTLRVHSSIDTIEFLDDPEGLMLVWIDPDPEEALTAQLGESTKMEGFSLTGVVIDETQGISAPGRRYAFTEIPTDHGSILIRDDAMYPERGPA